MVSSVGRARGAAVSADCPRSAAGPGPQGTPPLPTARGVPIAGVARWARCRRPGRPAAPDRTRRRSDAVLEGNARPWRRPAATRRALPAHRPRPRHQPAALPPDRDRAAPLDPRRPDRRRAPCCRGSARFARHLGVGAVTVMTAYDQLTAEGFLEPQARARDRGGPGPAGAARGLRAPHGVPARRSPAGPEPRAAPAVLRRGALRSPVRLPDRGDEPRPVPVGGLGAAAAPRVARPGLGPRARDHVPLPGGRSAPARGARRVPRRGPGGQGGSRADRRSRRGPRGRSPPPRPLWLGPDRPLAVEDPGSPYLQRSFSASGVPLVHVPVDARGLLVERLPDGPRAVMVTPSWQYPAGGTMPVARRMQLLHWAAAHEAVVIEDDTDAEPRYEGHPQPSLQGLDERGHVLYVGTFSKVLFPGLRTGYAVVPGCRRRGVRRPARGRPPGPGAPSTSAPSPCSSPRGTSSGTWSGSAPTTPSARRRCSTRWPPSSGPSSAPSRPPPARTSSSGWRTSGSPRRSWPPGPAPRRRGRAAVVLAPSPRGRPGAAAPLRAADARRDPGRRPAPGPGGGGTATRVRLRRVSGGGRRVVRAGDALVAQVVLDGPGRAPVRADLGQLAQPVGPLVEERQAPLAVVAGARKRMAPRPAPPPRTPRRRPGRRPRSAPTSRARRRTG